MNAEDTGLADHSPQILRREDGSELAWCRLSGESPGIIFLHGFRSDMQGSKALALEEFCRQRGLSFLRFDVFGHGQSSGRPEDGCISRWAEDVLAALDCLTSGPQILVGSSMGGWLALLAAVQRPHRVAGLVGIAAAPDFTEDLMWNDFTPEQRQKMMTDGYVLMPNCMDPAEPWVIPRHFIEDGRNNLLLRDHITLTCPVRLLQGQQDADVPWETALNIAQHLDSTDVQITLVKDGDHRLSREQDISLLLRIVDDLVAKIPK